MKPNKKENMILGSEKRVRTKVPIPKINIETEMEELNSKPQLPGISITPFKGNLF
jgi:hypothetical protein